MKQKIEQEEYIKEFVGKMKTLDNTYIEGSDEKSNQIKKKTKKLEEAYKAAADIRKFEIELYWKRATYFWTLIAAAFAGYGASWKADCSYSKIQILCSMLGFMFSLSWFFVNKGSKFWQNNWERHVDLLEDYVVGPLYKTPIEDKLDKCDIEDGKCYIKDNQICEFLQKDNSKKSAGYITSLVSDITSPAQYSVSKINQILSFFVMIIWLALFISA